MVAKSLLISCILAAIQNLNAQCIGAYEPNRAPWGPYGTWPAPIAPHTAETLGFAPATLSASNGGNFAVQSTSPISPTGIHLTSENSYEGPVSVAGKIPFLGTVEFDGELPTKGAGAVSYSCGNGNVAIANEIGAGFSEPQKYGHGFVGY